MERLKFYMYAFAAGIAATLLLSCTEAEQLMDDEIPTSKMEEAAYSVSKPALTRSESIALTVQQKGTYEISENEAIENLERFSAFISGNKNSVVKTKSISLKKSPETGREMYYEVVFDSDKGTGFSILSADERADELLCYAEVGAISDTSFNKSLKFCLELVDMYVEEQTKEELNVETLALSAKEKFVAINSVKAADGVITKAIPPFNPDDPNSPWQYDRTETRTTVDERVKLVPGGWYQTSPFNDFLPYIPPQYNQRAYAGCDVIAVSQIMAYHKKPFSNYITSAMWPSMIANYRTSVELKNLIRDMFNYMVISYDVNGTSSNMARARSFLNGNGFSAGSGANYSYNGVWNALNYGPTYIRGGNTAGAGHAWVVDGARTTTTTWTEIYSIVYNGRIVEAVGNSYTSTSKQVRYDWGWGNANENTWFNDNVFRASPSDENFNTNVGIISFIY